MRHRHVGSIVRCRNRRAAELATMMPPKPQGENETHCHSLVPARWSGTALPTNSVPQIRNGHRRPDRHVVHCASTIGATRVRANEAKSSGRREQWRSDEDMPPVALTAGHSRRRASSGESDERAMEKHRKCPSDPNRKQRHGYPGRSTSLQCHGDTRRRPRKSAASARPLSRTRLSRPPVGRLSHRRHVRAVPPLLRRPSGARPTAARSAPSAACWRRSSA